MKTALIIGAGPAGLTAAYELLKQSDEIKVIVLEESECCGGISKTVAYKGNRMDMGGHRFFSKMESVNEWWEKVLPAQGAPALDDIILQRSVPISPNGPDPQKEDRVFLNRRRVSRILFDGKFYDYPISLKWETLTNMGIVNTIEGNKGDKVTRCSYSKSSPSIIGYGRPKYELIGGTIPESEEYDMPQIQRGSKGKAVKILQIILGDLEVDGSFGPATQAATLDFQRKHGLTSDGIVGPKTWRALFDTLI